MTIEGPPGRLGWPVWVCAFLAAGGWLYLALFTLAGIPVIRMTWAWDQWINLEGAMRMLAGQRIYIDFFQYTLPGTELLYLLFFKVWGVRAWIPNAVLLLTGLGCFLMAAAISRRVLSGWSVFLPGTFFLSMLLAVPDAQHHKLSIALALAAVTVLIERRSALRIVTAGLLIGLATCFTQSRGLTAIGGIAAFILWEKWRAGERASALLLDEALLIAPFAAVVGSVSALQIAKLGLARFIRLIVIFPIRYYPAETRYNTLRALWYQPIPSLTRLAELPMVVLYGLAYLLPLCYAVCLLRYRRRRSDPIAPWNELMLVAAAGLSLLLSVWYAPDFGRMAEVSLPAFILFVWLLEAGAGSRKWLVKAAWALALALVIFPPLKAQFGWYGRMVLPAGTVAFVDRSVYRIYEWLLAHTHPGEMFLESGDMDDTYFLMHLDNPIRVPYLTANGYTRPEQVLDAIRSLDKHNVKYILWDTDLDHPVPSDAPTDHLGPLHQYLRLHYTLVKGFDNCQFSGRCQVLERNGVAPETDRSADIHESSFTKWETNPHSCDIGSAGQL